MTDSDIQFGEIEEPRRQRRKRPDQDGHYATVTYGMPGEEDLPVFIDIDVLAEMEAHAQTNRDIELGGVMLGGQYEDESGAPFVLVVDSLRAEHFENSRSHFKFTHETWSAITRQRETFSNDLTMVGWYHTHPNWGVFLSGQDEFICRNFFNRSLDVALVIDPYRLDRGVFHWAGANNERLPRAGGFHVMASRFRQKELTTYTESLENKMDTRTTGGPTGTTAGDRHDLPRHVLHTVRPQLGWVGMAVVALLIVQVCATMMLGGRTATPAESSMDAPTARMLQLQEELAQRQERLAAREKMLERFVGHVVIGTDGHINVQSLMDENRQLNREVEHLREATKLMDELGAQLARLRQNESRLVNQVAELQQAKREAEATNEDLAALFAQQANAMKDSSQEADGTPPSSQSQQDAGNQAASVWTSAFVILIMVGIVVAANIMVDRRQTRRKAV